MKIEGQSYRARYVRPKPRIFTSQDGNFAILTVSWGEPEVAQMIEEEIIRYVEAARADVEVTSPFEFQTSLSSEANYLRIATLIANDQLFRQKNKKSYDVGVEVLCLLKNQNEISYAKVGFGNIAVLRPSTQPILITGSSELGSEFSEPGQMPPLPKNLLGVEAYCALDCGSFRIQDSDKVLIISTGHIPLSFWGLSHLESSIEMMTRLGHGSLDESFWFGKIDL